MKINGQLETAISADGVDLDVNRFAIAVEGKTNMDVTMKLIERMVHVLGSGIGLAEGLGFDAPYIRITLEIGSLPAELTAPKGAPDAH